MKRKLCGHEFYRYFWQKVIARKDFSFVEQMGEKYLKHNVKKGAIFYLNRPGEGIYNVCFKAEYAPEKDSTRAYVMTFPKSEFHKCFKILPDIVTKHETDDRFENDYYEAEQKSEEKPEYTVEEVSDGLEENQ